MNRLTKKTLSKVIDNIEPEDDCCGKWDLDFDLLTISTRCWRDNTAVCHIDLKTGDCDSITLVKTKNYIKATTRAELEKKCKEWYKKNISKAFLKLVALAREE